MLDNKKELKLHQTNDLSLDRGLVPFQKVCFYLNSSIAVWGPLKAYTFSGYRETDRQTHEPTCTCAIMYYADTNVYIWVYTCIY